MDFDRKFLKQKFSGMLLPDPRGGRGPPSRILPSQPMVSDSPVISTLRRHCISRLYRVGVCVRLFRWCWCKGGEHSKRCKCTTRNGHGAPVMFNVVRATAHDAGNYVLYGRNRHGHVRSATFLLRMAGKPICHYRQR